MQGEPATDQGTKRLLSPESVQQPDILDKRLRHDSLEFEDQDPSQKIIPSNMEGKDSLPKDLNTWMAQISGQLKMTVQKSDLDTLATKEDLSIIRDNITAQGEEINQLRQEIAGYKKDLDSLRTTFDLNEAEKLNRKLQTAGRYVGQNNNNPRNLASADQFQTSRPQSTRRNLVIEGLTGNDENEMIASLLKLTTALGLVVYKCDIDAIFRMKRRNVVITTPGPVLVIFNRVTVRDNILKNKVNLRHIDGMKETYVNADEPLEVRRTKAMFRKISVIARNAGETVDLRYNSITIGDEYFSLEDLRKIPRKYLPSDMPDATTKGMPSSRTSETGMESEEETSKKDEATAATPSTSIKRRAVAAKPMIKPGLVLPGEKMRICKAGLCFSGPFAYPSNMHPTPITYNKKDYKSNEQAYQCTKAESHDELELAKFLKELTDAREIKIEASHIVTTDEWKQKSPEILWDMFDLKMKQNPDLLERLIQTAPLTLIEASTSMRWGGGPHSIPHSTTQGNTRGEMNLALQLPGTEIKKYLDARPTKWCECN